MNILLFAPALLLAYITSQGIYGTIKHLSICAGIQVYFTASSSTSFSLILKMCPFLSPSDYFRSSFSFDQSYCLYGWIVQFRTRFLI